MGKAVILGWKHHKKRRGDRIDEWRKTKEEEAYGTLKVFANCLAQQVCVGRTMCSLRIWRRREEGQKGEKKSTENMWLSMFPAEAAESWSDRSLSRTFKHVGSESIPSNSKSEQTRHTKEGVGRGIIIQNSWWGTKVLSYLSHNTSCLKHLMSQAEQ